MTTDDLVEQAIDRILSGRDNCGTLVDAVCNRDRLYFRKAIAPVIAQLHDEANEFRRQRNAARSALQAVNALVADYPPDA